MAGIVKGVVIVGAKRTVVGSFGGRLKDQSACDLLVTSNKAAMVAANVQPEMIDTVNVGNVLTYSSADGIFLARHVSIKSGIPIEKPALQVNRLCGSGFQAVINGVHDVLNGSAKVSLTGGTENMSQAPFIIRNIRFGTQLGVSYPAEDSLWVGLTDTYCNLSMAMTAEKLGSQCNISKEDANEFALRSQMSWKAAYENGRFKEELVPIEVKGKKGPEVIAIDEHPKPHTTMEGLKKLKAVFKENGLVTAGTASGINDGAGTIIVASEKAASEYNLKPLARIVAYSTVGVDPSIMGIGPVPAIEKVLSVSGLTMDQMDLIEVTFDSSLLKTFITLLD
uniref:Thiolase N-terminal domain-containing protein n=1 Tax=Photinus pyralis TaxID=7054 RepID=A0A1Y1KW43_PHOPY